MAKQTVCNTSRNHFLNCENIEVRENIRVLSSVQAKNTCFIWYQLKLSEFQPFIDETCLEGLILFLRKSNKMSLICHHYTLVYTLFHTTTRKHTCASLSLIAQNKSSVKQPLSIRVAHTQLKINPYTTKCWCPPLRIDLVPKSASCKKCNIYYLAWNARNSAVACAANM